MKTVIQTNNLCREYVVGIERVVALKNANITVGAGELCCILGPSGSGKSTLLNLLAGFDNPSAGSITIGKSRISIMNEDERALFRQKHLGFVFQNFNLLPHLTACENVALPLMIKRVGRRQRQIQAMEELAEMGIADRAGHLPGQMSAGQQQRVAIARAFVGAPKIVFADEPTGNLDSDTTRIVLSALQNKIRRHGTTMLMVTHDETLADRADRILYIKDGHVHIQTQDNKAPEVAKQ